MRANTFLCVVLAAGLLGAACGSTTTTTNQPAATNAPGEASTPPDPTDAGGTLADDDQQAAFARAAADSFWVSALAECNAMMESTGGTAFFDGSAEDPTVGSSANNEVAPGVYDVTDNQGVVLLIDTNNQVITGADGPEGIMPRPYVFVCPPERFVGTFDEDGMMDEEDADGASDIGFELDANGLGTVDFLADRDNTIMHVSAALGEPDEDSGLILGYERYGICPSEFVRFVRWGDLEVVFADEGDPDDQYFFYWRVYAENGASGSSPTTAEGIGLGSTVADVRAAYGEDAVVYDDDFQVYNFFRSEGVSYGNGLVGAVSGDAPTDVVTFLGAGRGCAD